MKPKSIRTIILSILILSGLMTVVFGINAAKFFSAAQSNDQKANAKSANTKTIARNWNPLAFLAPAPPLFVAAGTAPTGNPGGFGIEGDLLANSPTNNVSDWLANGAGTGMGVLTAAGLPINSTTTYSSVGLTPSELFSSQADDIFSGGKKVKDDPNTWTWTAQKPTGKDDIHRGFFTTTIDVSGHTWVTAAADRLSTNGTSYLDFEFLQNPLTKNSDGSFTSLGPDGGRTIGDLLVTLELTGGGGTANFYVQRWQPVGAGFDYVDITPPSGTFFSSANAGIVSVPFGAFGVTTYDPNQFAETAFDLTALLPTLNPCIGIQTVLLKTKTSAASTATLKDFICPFQTNLGTKPLAKAGDDLAACQTIPGPTVFTVNGMAINGTPSWSIVGTTGGATANILSPNSASTGVNVTGTGTVTLRLTVTSAACGSVTDDVVLTVNAGAVAQIQPDVTSLTKCQVGATTTMFSLSGTVSSGSATPLWSTLPGGTATAVIATPNATTTDVTVTGTGFVDIQLRSQVSCGTATDTIRLNVNPSPTAVAGIDQTKCQTVPGPTVFTVNGTVTNATPAWSVASTTGTAAATIVSPTNASTNVNVTGVGTVTLSLVATSTVSCGTATSEVILTVNPLPTAAVTGSATICLGGSTNIQAALTGTGPWTVVWSDGVTQTNVLSSPATRTVTPTMTTIYTVTSVTDATTCSSAGTGSATVMVTNPPTTANAGPDQTLCVTSPATLAANTPTTGTGAWSIVSGPSTSLTQFSSLTSPSATFTPAGGAGDYILQWTISNAPCAASTDTIKLTYTPPPTTAAAGPDQTTCTSPITLAANTPTVGTGTWSIISGPNTSISQINNPNLPNASFSPNAFGTYVLRWTISNSPCADSFDEVTIVCDALPTTANAGPDQTLCTTSPATLAANTPSVGTGAWSIVSGPSTLLTQFSSTSSPTATFTPAGGNGTYILKWSITNGSCSPSEDTISLFYSAPPTAAAAGADQTLCTTTPATLAANTPVIGTGAWSIVSGPSLLTSQFSSLTAPGAVFTPAGGAGTYTLRWTISNSPCAASFDDVILNFSAPPTTAAAGPDQTLCTTTPATLAANTPVIGTGAWSIVSGPSLLTSQFSSTTNPIGTFTPAVAGSYTLRWTISNSPCAASFDDVVLNYTAPPTTAAAGPDQTLCTTSPAALAANTPSVGTGAWSIVSGPSTSLTQFSSTSSPTATFTPAGGAGAYTLRWTISNSPCTASFDDVVLNYTAPPTTANAGPDQSLCLTGPLTLAANTPSVGTGAWSIVSGPSTLLTQFSSTTSPTATFTPAGGVGNYLLRWTISNAPCAASTDDVLIKIGQAVTVDAGPAQSVTACAALGGIKLAGVIGGAATSATWSGGSGTFTPNPTTLLATYTPTTTEIAAGQVTLTLTTNDPDGPCGADSDNVTILITACADLSLTKTVDNPAPALGQNVVFTITVTNAGPSTATNVKVGDVLPAGLSFVSADLGAAYNSGTGVWTVGTLLKDASATLKITATVTQSGEITNSAQVTASDQPDPDSTPNNNVPTEDDQAKVTLNSKSDPTPPSDQKAGSLLVFPYYTSNSSTGSDTRFSITNLGDTNVKVHILLLDKSCAQADYMACITPNGTLTDRAIALDPENTGYILAFAVNAMGVPLKANQLIGNAFVNDGIYMGNYGAESFWFKGQGPTAPFADNTKTNTANLNFDLDYDAAPCELIAEIQSPVDAVGQKIVVVGLSGNVDMMAVTGAAQEGTGLVYNAQERGGSFQKFLTGSCYAETIISTTNPRVPTSLGGLIASGNSGHLRFSIGAGVGLLLTPKNVRSGWSGIRTLHKTKLTKTTLTIPVMMPDC